MPHLFGCLRMTTILTTVLFTSLVVAAQPALEPREFQETLDETVPISGETILGLQCASTEKRNDSTRVYVAIPDGEIESLSVTVASQDGKYLGRASYDVGDLPPGPASLRFPTAYGAALKGYRDTQLAIRASADDRQQAFRTLLLLSCWTDLAAEDQLLLLNAGRADAILLHRAKGKAEVVGTCERLDSEMKSVAFDTKCRLGSAHRDVRDLVISRRYFDTYLPNVTVWIGRP